MKMMRVIIKRLKSVQGMASNLHAETLDRETRDHTKPGPDFMLQRGTRRKAALRWTDPQQRAGTVGKTPRRLPCDLRKKKKKKIVGFSYGVWGVGCAVVWARIAP